MLVFAYRLLPRGLAAALLAMLLTGMACPPAGAIEQSVRPGINAPYENADVQYWVGIFEREGREIWDQRQAIVAALNLKPGMAVADIGAGTGFFVRLFAERVGPEGRVYAVDIARNFVADILRRARRDGQTWIQGIVNPPDRTALPPGELDLIFTSDTYHHFEYPRSMLASIHRSLKSGGRFVVVDFERVPGLSSGWVLDHVRAGKEAVIREVEAARFRLAEDAPLLRENYFLIFERVD
ncbi:MAG TPA: methyltransferase domain-containing protein [Thiobacillaceae bacterium]|nr:methyltransferase domain-containing protein [Thiobacillaceae bacterium]